MNKNNAFVALAADAVANHRHKVRLHAAGALAREFARGHALVQLRARVSELLRQLFHVLAPGRIPTLPYDLSVINNVLDSPHT